MIAFACVWFRAHARALFVALSPSGSAAFAQAYDVPYVPTPQVVVDEMLRVEK